MSNRLVANWSIEATPAQWCALPADIDLPAGSRVYVPALPKSSSRDVAAACKSIRARGYEPVPHLAARAMRSRAALAEWLQCMRDAGADALLLIAGDRRRPAGPFRNTLGVLDSGLVERFGFRRVGVAGHPEGHSQADEEALVAALRCKAAWARDTGSKMWIVTQFAFSAAPVIDWYERMSAEGIDMPLRIGLPGPARIQTLLRYAAQCGVGASARMLMRRPDAVSQLFNRWSPLGMLESLADGLDVERGMPVEGVHVFPFGGLQRSIEFFGALRHHAAPMQRTAASGS
jgi:methylenetetrahydrofolate reductase (NADPH)